MDPYSACWRARSGLGGCGEISPMLLRLPDTRQRKSHKCSEAATRCVLRFHGLTDPLPFSTPQDGADPRQLEAAFRLARMHVLSGEADLDLIRHCCNQGRPPICLIQWVGENGRSVGHYVTVAGVAYRKVHYLDPWDGPTSLPAETWEERWHDAGRCGDVFRQWMICGWPVV